MNNYKESTGGISKKDKDMSGNISQESNAPGMEVTDSIVTITYNTSQAGGAYEDIYRSDDNFNDTNIIVIPVSLHIDETKELKSLFYTIK